MAKKRPPVQFRKAAHDQFCDDCKQVIFCGSEYRRVKWYSKLHERQYIFKLHLTCYPTYDKILDGYFE